MNTEDLSGRLVLDYDSVRADVENILGEIDSLRSNKLFIAALGENSARKVRDNCAAVRKCLSDAFNVVVIGDFKRGKSTLINALIGDDIVPAAVTPETVTINRLSFSETPKAEAVLKNGHKMTLAHNELKREAIEKISGQLPSEIDYVDIRANVEILREISIVDTPGIGDLLKAFDQKIADYLMNADALIYVLSVKSPFSMTERAFLSTAVMPQGFARVLAVVNMADTLETPENINKITEFTKEKAAEINPDIYVYTLSALDELCRKKGVKRPEPDLAAPLEANFLEFETALNNDIILQKDIIKSTRAAALTRISLDDIANRINLVKNSLRANVEKLALNEEEFKNENSALMKKIEKKKAELASDIDGMRREAKGWMAEFMARLKDEIRGAEKNAEVSDLEKHFQFYMSDQIKNAVMTCVERHRKDISDRISDITKSVSSEIAENAFGSIDAKIAENIADIGWTNMDFAMFWGKAFIKAYGVDLVPIVPNIVLIGQVITGYLRQNTVSKRQADFLAPILQGFDSIDGDVIKNADAVYEKLKLAAIDKLRETFQNQIETSLDAINMAKQIALDESVKSEDVAEYLDSALTGLEKHRDVLNKYN
jgi:GTPase SAR1 family protein